MKEASEEVEFAQIHLRQQTVRVIEENRKRDNLRAALAELRTLEAERGDKAE